MGAEEGAAPQVVKIAVPLADPKLCKKVYKVGRPRPPPPPDPPPPRSGSPGCASGRLRGWRVRCSDRT